MNGKKKYDSLAACEPVLVSFVWNNWYSPVSEGGGSGRGAGRWAKGGSGPWAMLLASLRKRVTWGFVCILTPA